MKTFKAYLNEKVNEDFLYHNTDYFGFANIMEYGALSQTEITDVARGKKRLKRGYVSLTRDKRYYGAPGASNSEVRLVFKKNKLKNRYKMRPKADRSVVYNSKDDLQVTVKGYDARWESEEIVLGPIDTKYIERIEISKDTYKKRLNYIEMWEESLEGIKDRKEKLKQGYFWNQPKKKYVKIEDYPKVSKEMIKKRIDNYEESYEELIRKEQKILSDKRIKIV